MTEELKIARLDNGYNDSVYYSQTIEDGADISKQLNEVIAKITELEKEKKSLIDCLVRRADVPCGWKVKLKDYYNDGRIDVIVYKDIYREHKIKPAVPQKEEKKIPQLSRLLRIIDSKTLFNSGILTAEKKKSLIEEYLASEPTESANIPF